ncbi:MAG: OmpA family protein [Bacteroidales bacterium]|nr:OmpA family protein [Candidatus Colicola faecequi]
MKHFSNHICCVVALFALLTGVSASAFASEEKSDTLKAEVNGKTLYCTYTEGRIQNDYVITLLNFDSVGQYDEFSSAIAQEIYMNYKELFNSKDQVRLIVEYAEEAAPRDTNLVLRFEGCYFDFDKAVIKAEFYDILDNAAVVLQQLNKRVAVCGYTDSTGSESYNLELSKRRAMAVRSYLIKKGCNPDMLTAKGFGESNPIATNSTPEGRAKNRRCELRLNED